MEGNASQTTYRIELIDAVHQTVTDQINIQGGGPFEFRNVSEGNYRVRVVRGSEIVSDEHLHAQRFGGEIFLRVTEAPSRRRAPTDIVSVKTLQHKPDRKARKLFQQSEKLHARNKLEESIGKLREAIAIDPDYMEAHNNLGSRLVQSGNPADALGSFQRAAELDPDAPKVLTNMGVACMQLGRLKDAEDAARRALSIDPSSQPAHYILGISLAGQRKELQQALDHLRIAGETIPHARLAVAQILIASGSIEQARQELRTYLATGQPAKKAEVEAWLNRLR